MRKLAISDIHGCLKTLKVLVEQQIALTPQDELYLLGDFIDRGPDSKGVLDYVMQLQAGGYQIKCLKGNHEAMMVSAVTDPDEIGMWVYNGGQEALKSFGTEVPGEIDPKYVKFVDEMPHYYEVGKYILVHAGLNFQPDESDRDGQGFLWRMHNPLRDEQAMLWIRWWYDDIDWNWMKDRVIVHGHTPVEFDDIWDMFEVLDEDQILDIDNGCYAKYKEGMGQLCAFDMTYRELYFQENIEEVETSDYDI